MDERELTALVEDHIGALQVPGAAVAVLEDEEIVVATGGVANIESGRPVSATTQFSIASVTKPMVATVIAILADQGDLDFDDPIARHIPELRSASWCEEVTITHLLENVSGVPLRVAWEFNFDDKQDRALERFCETLAPYPLQTPAGQRWSYCNTGWSLLGRAIETIMGVPWLEAMRAVVFHPLGMHQTGSHHEMIDPVTGYEVIDGSEVAVAPWNSPGLGPGGAVLWSSASDLIRFAGPHVGVGQGFDERIAEALRKPQVGPEIWPWMDRWYRGWAFLDWMGGPVWGWDGVTRGGRAQLRIVPAKRGAIAILTNGGGGRALYWSLMPVLMEALYDVSMRGPVEEKPSRRDLRPFEGRFAWPDDEIVVHARSDRLVISRGQDSIEAVPTDDKTFVLTMGSPDPPTITFDSFDSEGRPHTLYWLVWGHPRSG